MKLDKSDALLIHSVLFAYGNSDISLQEDEAELYEDLQTRLKEFIVSEDNHERHEDCDDCEDPYEDEDEDEEEEDVEESHVELYVTPKSVSELSPAKVISPDGSTVTLEFEDIGEPETVDVLVADGSIIIDGISKVVLNSENLALHDGEDWHQFKVQKLPKMWKKTFPFDVVVGFHEDEGEDEE
jgi:hypothetical protein